MANRLLVVIYLHTCLTHVVHPSSYITFANPRGPKETNQLDIRTLFPGFHSTNGLTVPYVPNTHSINQSPRVLDQVIPSQILSKDLQSSTMVRILPNPNLSTYQSSSQWTKTPGFGTGDFIRGFFQAADVSPSSTIPTSPIGLGPACDCTSGVRESGRNNFHESVRSSGSGSRFLDYSDYRKSNEYDDLVNGFSGSTRFNELGHRLGESVYSNCRSGSNLGGSYCSDGSKKSYDGLRSNYESVSSKAGIGRSYSNCDVSTSRNSGLGRNVVESVSSKSKSEISVDKLNSGYDGNTLGDFVPSKIRPGSNFGVPYCSYDSKCNHNVVESVSSKSKSESSVDKLNSSYDGNTLGDFVPQTPVRPGSNFCEPYYKYGSKSNHGSTNSNESTNGSGRMGSYGESNHGKVSVAGELPVVGRTTVAGRVPITGGVKFNGFIPAAGRVTIGGSCYCGPPFAF